jgi:hypothetical protein
MTAPARRCGDLVLERDPASGVLRCTMTVPGPTWAGFPVWSGSGAAWSVRLVGCTVAAPLPDTALDGSEEVLLAGLADLPGRWAAVAQHRASGDWVAATDRFGSLHLFVTAVPDGRVDRVGTVPPRRTPAGVDRVALGSLALFGFPLGDRTLDERTRVLPPATVLRLDRDGVVRGRRRYWDWSHRPDTRRSRAETLAELWDLVRVLGVDQIPDGSAIVLPISGGLDSRVLTAALAASPGRPAVRAFTYGYDAASSEIAAAVEVGRRAGIPPTTFLVPPYLFERADLLADALDGACDVTQSRQAGIRDELAGFAGDDALLLGGHYGDLWLDHTGIPDGADVTAEAVRRFVKPGGREALGLFGLDEAVVRAAAAEELAGVAGRLDGIADADFRLKALKVDTYGHRFTAAGLRMYQTAAFPIVPFGDPRFVDWIGTVPGHLLPRRRLEIDLLCRYAPDLASVVWDGHGASPRRFRHPWTLVPGRLVRRARRTVGRGGPLPVTRNWEVQFLGDGLPRLRSWVREDPWPAWADRDRALAAVAELERHPGDRRHGYALSVLFSVVSWERAARSGAWGRAAAATMESDGAVDPAPFPPLVTEERR